MFYPNLGQQGRWSLAQALLVVDIAGFHLCDLIQAQLEVWGHAQDQDHYNGQQVPGLCHGEKLRPQLNEEKRWDKKSTCSEFF